MTPALRASHVERQRRYANGRGWANKKVGQYRATDKRRGFENDLDAAWFRENIETKPCRYCGDAAKRSGADRVDNSKGHTKANVVPCCHDCNTSRMNRFSHDEMVIIGAAIKEIKRRRLIHGLPENALHLASR